MSMAEATVRAGAAPIYTPTEIRVGVFDSTASRLRSCHMWPGDASRHAHA